MSLIISFIQLKSIYVSILEHENPFRAVNLGCAVKGFFWILQEAFPTEYFRPKNSCSMIFPLFNWYPLKISS